MAMLGSNRANADYRVMAEAEAKRTGGIDAVAVCAPN